MSTLRSATSRATHFTARACGVGCALIAVAAFSTSCDKNDKKIASSAVEVSSAEFAKLSKEEQLMELLKIAQKKRLQLSVGRRNIKRVQEEYSTAHAKAVLEFQAAESELAEMKEKYKRAKSALKISSAANEAKISTPPPPLNIEYKQTVYSESGFKILFALKNSEKEKLEKRMRALSEGGNLSSQELEKVHVAVAKLDQEVKEFKRNIEDIKFGQEIVSIQERVKKISDINVGAITTSILEDEAKAKQTLSAVAATESANANAVSQADLAKADSLLNEK